MKNSLCLLLTLFLAWGCSDTGKSPEQQAREIHAKVLTVDTHTDTPWALLRGGYDMNQRYDHSKDRLQVDFPRMKEGGLDAVFWAAFIGQRERDSAGNRRAEERILKSIDSIRSHVNARNETAGIATTPGDAYKLKEEGRLAIFIGIENGYAIGNDIENIAKYYEKGVRYVTLCHTRNNDICDSSTDTTEHNGLSDFGIEVVKEMNRVGMMIDVSHISDSSFYEVLEYTKTPVIASHSSARAVCDNPRNLNDDMLRELSANGGVIQVCLLSDYVKTPEPYPERDSAQNAVREKYRNFTDLIEEEKTLARREWYAVDSLYPRKLATVADFVDHIDHIVEVIGVEYVGIGSDFDGGGGLDDCRDVSQMGNITLELVKRGYTEEEIRRIWGGNIMRVMKQVQQHADNATKMET